MIFSKIDEENSDTILGRVKQTLVNHVDIGARFSEARCSKALPLAFAAYKEGLQSHYLAEVHNAKVNFLITFSPSTSTSRVHPRCANVHNCLGLSLERC